jgi:hypothetical protein
MTPWKLTAGGGRVEICDYNGNTRILLETENGEQILVRFRREPFDGDLRIIFEQLNEQEKKKYGKETSSGTTSTERGPRL